MEIDAARDFIRDNHRAVLATRRRDGSVQMSPVLAAIDDAGRAIISSNEGKAKVLNLRRHPEASVCVFTNRFFGDWLQVDGTAEILSLPDALEPLVDYYRRVSGEHDDWDEYRSAMVNERRCLIRVTIQRAGP
jgi:PPOX class probable F420-dependent enzyme